MDAFRSVGELFTCLFRRPWRLVRPAAAQLTPVVLVSLSLRWQAGAGSLAKPVRTSGRDGRRSPVAPEASRTATTTDPALNRAIRRSNTHGRPPSEAVRAYVFVELVGGCSTYLIIRHDDVEQILDEALEHITRALAAVGRRENADNEADHKGA